VQSGKRRGAHQSWQSAAQQKHSEAIDHYVKALRSQPQEATVHLGLANSLEAAGRSFEAVVQYREALRLNPTLPEAQFNLGTALAKQGDLPAATTCFQEAVRLNSEDPQGHLNLGVALAQQNRLTEAIAQFQAVLRIDPANAAAKQYLRTVYAPYGHLPDRLAGPPRPPTEPADHAKNLDLGPVTRSASTPTGPRAIVLPRAGLGGKSDRGLWIINLAIGHGWGLYLAVEKMHNHALQWTATAGS
jgi:tetratricopeptide (TPR) repeat protein